MNGRHLSAQILALCLAALVISPSALLVSSESVGLNELSLTVGGDVVDGVIPAYKFYGGSAQIDLTACGFTFGAGADEDSDLCTIIAERGDDTAWSGPTWTSYLDEDVAWESVFTQADSDCSDGGSTSLRMSGDRTVLTVFFDGTQSSFATDDYVIEEGSEVTVTLPLHLDAVSTVVFQEGDEVSVSFTISYSNFAGFCTLQPPTYDYVEGFLNGFLEVTVELDHQVGMWSPDTLADSDVVAGLLSDGISGTGFELITPLLDTDALRLKSLPFNLPQDTSDLTLEGEGFNFMPSDIVLYRPSDASACDQADVILIDGVKSVSTDSVELWSVGATGGDCDPGTLRWVPHPVTGRGSITVEDPDSFSIDAGDDSLFEIEAGDLVIVFGGTSDTGGCAAITEIRHVHSREGNNVDVDVDMPFLSPETEDCEGATVSRLSSHELDVFSNDNYGGDEANVLHITSFDYADDSGSLQVGDYVFIQCEDIDGDGNVGYTVGQVEALDDVLDTATLSGTTHPGSEGCAEISGLTVHVLDDYLETPHLGITIPAPVEGTFGVTEDEYVSYTPATSSIHFRFDSDASGACEGSWTLEAPTCTINIDSFTVEDVNDEDIEVSFTLELNWAQFDLDGQTTSDFFDYVSGYNVAGVDYGIGDAGHDHGFQATLASDLIIESSYGYLADSPSQTDNIIGFDAENPASLAFSVGDWVLSFDEDGTCDVYVAQVEEIEWDDFTGDSTVTLSSDSSASCGSQMLYILRTDDTTIPGDPDLSVSDTDDLEHIFNGDIDAEIDATEYLEEGDAVLFLNSDGCTAYEDDLLVVNTVAATTITTTTDLIADAEGDCTGGEIVRVRTEAFTATLYTGGLLTGPTSNGLEAGDMCLITCETDTVYTTIGRVSAVTEVDSEFVFTIEGADYAGEETCNPEVLKFKQKASSELVIHLPTNEDYYIFDDEELSFVIPPEVLTTSAQVTCTGALTAEKIGKGSINIVDDDFAGGWWNNQAALAITQRSINEGVVPGGDSLKLKLELGTLEWVVNTDELKSDALDGFSDSLGVFDVVLTAIQDDIANLVASVDDTSDNPEALEIVFPAVEEFELTAVTTVYANIDISFTNSAASAVSSSDPTMIEFGELLVYPNGYLDQAENIAFGIASGSDGAAVWWTHGSSTYEIVSYMLECASVGGLEDLVLRPQPPAMEYMRFLTTEFDTQLVAGDQCMITATDLYGNQMSTLTPVAEDLLGSVPTKVLSVKLDSSTDYEWSPVDTLDIGEAGDMADAGTTSLSLATENSMDVFHAGAIVRITHDDQTDDAYARVESVASSSAFTLADDGVDVAVAHGASVQVLLSAATVAYFSWPEYYGTGSITTDYVAGGATAANGVLVEDYHTVAVEVLDDVTESALLSVTSADPSVRVDDIPNLNYGHVYSVEYVTSAGDESLDEALATPIAVEFVATYSVPERAPPPVVETVRAQGFVLKWKPPPLDGGFPVTKYVVQCDWAAGTSDFDGEWDLEVTVSEVDVHNAVIPRAIVDGVASGTMYYCRVNSHNAVGSSMGYLSGFQGTEGSGVTVTSVTTDSRVVQLSEALADVPFPVPVYIGETFRWACSQDEDEGTLTLEVPIDDDLEGEEILFTNEVWTASEIPDSYSSMGWDLCASAPYMVANLTATTTYDSDNDRHTVTVTWDDDTRSSESTFSGESVTAYRIEFWQYDSDGSWSDISLSCVGDSEHTFCDNGDTDTCNTPVSDIVPGHYYRVAVSARSEAGNSGPAAEVFFLVENSEISESDNGEIGSCGALGFSDLTLSNIGTLNPGLTDVNVWGDGLDDVNEDADTIFSASVDDWNVDVEFVEFGHEAVYLRFPRPCAFDYSDDSGPSLSYKVSLSASVDNQIEPTHYEVILAAGDYVEYTDPWGAEYVHAVIDKLEPYRDIDGSDSTITVVDSLVEDVEDEDAGKLMSDSSDIADGTCGQDFLDRVPIRPFAPTLSFGLQSMGITWSAVRHNGGHPVREYQVQYRVEYGLWQDAEPEVLRVGEEADDEYSVFVFGLTLGMRYFARVRACNTLEFIDESLRGGCGAWSYEGHIRLTVPDPETSVNKPVVQAKSYDTLWITPAYVSDDVVATTIACSKTCDAEATYDRCYMASSKLVGVEFLDADADTLSYPIYSSANDWAAVSALETGTSYMCYSISTTSFGYTSVQALSNFATTDDEVDSPAVPLSPQLSATSEDGVDLVFGLPSEADADVITACDVKITFESQTDVVEIAAPAISGSLLISVTVEQDVLADLSGGDGFGINFIAAARCAIDGSYSSYSPATEIESHPNFTPPEVEGVTLVAITDRAALIQWEDIEVGQLDGYEVTSWILSCEDSEGEEVSVEASNDDLSAHSFENEEGTSLLLQQHLTGLEPAKAYECWVVASTDAETESAKPTDLLSINTLTDSSLSGSQQLPLPPLPPFVSSTGIDVDIDSVTVGSSVPITPWSVVISWADYCNVGTPVVSKNCLGVESLDFNSGSGSENEFFYFFESAAEEVAVAGQVLRYRNSFLSTDWTYLVYDAGTTDTGMDLTTLAGSNTYEFQLAVFSTYAQQLETTLEDLHFSTALEITTPFASAPDTPNHLVLGDTPYHTRTALWLTTDSAGMGFDQLNANGDPITKYEFQCRHELDTAWTTATIRGGLSEVDDGADTEAAVNSGVVSNLVAGEKFLCRARAHNVIGASGWSHIYNEDSEASLPSVQTSPLRVNRPSVDLVTADFIRVTWSQSESDDGLAVAGYHLTMSLVNDDGSEDTDSAITIETAVGVREYEFTGLASFTTYAFSVTAFNRLISKCVGDDAAESEPSPSLWVTTERADDSAGQLSAIVMPSLDVFDAGAEAVILTWDEDVEFLSGEDGATVLLEFGEIDEEGVIVWQEFDDTNMYGRWTTWRYRYVTGLSASATYAFRLKASFSPTFTTVTATAFSNVVEADTLDESKPMPPLPVSEDGLTNVEMTATITDEGIQTLSFDIADGTESQETGASNGDATPGYLVSFKSAPSDMEVVVAEETVVDTNVAGDHFVTAVAGLKALTEYSVSLVYVDEDGVESEEFTDFVTGTTLCTQGSAVSGVAIVRSDDNSDAAFYRELLLSWSEASSVYDLSHYLIQCSQTEDFSGVVRDVETPDARFTQWMVDGLSAGKAYYCKVTAVSNVDACSSPASSVVGPFQTLDAISSRPLKIPPPYKLMCDEPHIDLEDAESESLASEVSIGWVDLSAFQSVERYDMQVKRGSTWETVRLEESDEVDPADIRKVSVTGLDAGTRYMFRVRGVNALYDGPWSDEYSYPEADDEQEVLASAADTPIAEIHDMTRSFAVVTWTVSNNGGEQLTSHDIQCKRGAPVGDGSDVWPYSLSADGDVRSAAVPLWETDDGDVRVRAPSREDAVALGLDEEDDSFTYFCRVRAVNNVAPSLWSEAVSMGEDIPTVGGQPLAPVRPSLVSATAETITVSFPLPADDDGSPLRGCVFLMDGEEIKEMDLDDLEDLMLFEDGDGTLEKMTLGESLDISVSSLLPNTAYTFTHACWNRHVFDNVAEDEREEYGLLSPSLTVYTKFGERLPTPPAPILYEAGKAALLIEWEKPEGPEGLPLLEVRAYCRTEDPFVDEDGDEVVGASADDADYSDLYDNHTIDKEICGSEEECEAANEQFALTGLTSETGYHCIITYENPTGLSLGDYNEASFVTMGDSTALSFISAPSVTDITEYTATIYWGDDLHYYGTDIDGLQYFVYHNHSNNEIASLHIDDELYLLDDLQPSTFYSVWFWVVDTGYVSPAVSFETLPLTSEPVTGLELFDANKDSFVLQWDYSWDLQNASPTSYDIECTDVTNSTVETFEATHSMSALTAFTDTYIGNQQFVLAYFVPDPALDDDTEYVCRVRFENLNGDTSEWSAISGSMATTTVTDSQPLAIFPANEASIEGAFEETLDGGHLTSSNAIKISFGDYVGSDSYSDGQGGNGGETFSSFLVRYYRSGESDYKEGLVLATDDEITDDARWFLASGLDADTTYQFTIRARIEDELAALHSSDWSVAKSIKTAQGHVPDTPTPPVIQDTAPEWLAVEVSSFDNGNNITQYEVECYGDQTGSSSSSSPHSVMYVKVVEEDKLWCRARASNSLGTSAWSFHSYQVQSEGAERKEPLIMLPVRTLYTTRDSAIIQFSSPPLVGGDLAPAIGSMKLAWSLAEESGDEVDLDSDAWSAFEWSVKEWCESLGDVSVTDCRANIGQGIDTVEFTYEVTGLLGANDYHFTVQAIAGTVLTLEGAFSVFDILGNRATTEIPKLPGAVTEATLLDQTDTSFLFQWIVPESNGAPITAYEIRCFNASMVDDPDTSLDYVASVVDDEVIESSSVLIEYYIDGLESLAEYMCRIVTTNAAGSQVGDMIADTWWTEDGDGQPLRMLALTFESATDSTATFGIHPGPDSDKYEDFVVRYLETYLLAASSIPVYEQSIVSIDDEGSVTVSNLTPNTEYVFTVQATTAEVGTSLPSSSAAGTTAAGKPQWFDHGILSLSFIAAGEVEDYDTSVVEEGICFELSLPSTSCHLTLSPASVRGELLVYGKKGREAEEISDDIHASLISEVFGADVVDLETTISRTSALDITSDAAYITWPPVYDSDSPITQYRGECVESDDLDQLPVECVVSKTSGDEMDLEPGCAMHPLKPDTSYICRLSKATNALGSVSADGWDNAVAVSDQFTTLSESDVSKPLRMRRVSILESLDDSEITVRWKVPASDGGAEVSGYRLEYSFANLGDEPKTIDVDDADTLEVDISGLFAGQTYEFRVVALNSELSTSSIATDHWSNARLHKVDYGVPGAPASPQYEALGLTEVDVILTITDTDGFRVNGGLSVDRYVVQVIAGEEADIAAGRQTRVEVGGFSTVAMTTSRYRLADMDPDTVYQVRYCIINEFGQGDWSAVTKISSEAVEASAVDVIEAQVVESDQELVMKWSEPSADGGSEIKSYSLCVNGVGPEGLYQVETPNCADYAVESLEFDSETALYSMRWPYTSSSFGTDTVVRGGEYRVGVAAKTDIGTGFYSFVESMSIPSGLSYEPVLTLVSAQESDKLTWEITAVTDLQWHGGSAITRVESYINGIPKLTVDPLVSTITQVEGDFVEQTEYVVVVDVTNAFGVVSVTQNVTTGVSVVPEEDATSSTIVTIGPAAATSPLMIVTLLCLALIVNLFV